MEVIFMIYCCFGFVFGVITAASGDASEKHIVMCILFFPGAVLGLLFAWFFMWFLEA